MLPKYFVYCILFLLIPASAVTAFPQSPPATESRIVQSIDQLNFVRLQGHIPRRALPQYDQGQVAPSFKLSYITLELKATAAQQQALDLLLKEQQDSSSPNYHKWLTPEQYADRFGLSQADIAKLTDWLTKQGFTIAYVGRARNLIAFDGTAQQVQDTFRTEIHRFTLGGEQHFANVSEPAVPAALAGVVSGIGGLHDFLPKPNLKKSSEVRSIANPDASGTLVTLTPPLFASIYDVNPLYNAGFTGSGQKIVIVGQSNPDFGDVATFRSNNGLPAITPQAILVGSAPGSTESAANVYEQDLDLETSGAVAPGAALIYVYSTSATSALSYALDQDLAAVMSASYGLCEPDASTLLESHLKMGVSLGITVLASAGDSGAADCDLAFNESGTSYPPDNGVAREGLAVSYPASSPEVTAVGGTEFTQGSTGGYVPETTWNDTSPTRGLAAAGGGVSIISTFVKPSWQNVPGVPNDGFRDVPDIALASSPNVDPYSIVVNNGQIGLFGGTSLAAPTMAGIVALLNQYLVAKGTISTTGLGMINPALYQFSQTSPGSFHDITTGNNLVPCQTGTPNCVSGGPIGYSAGVGYDQTTGLGSIDANNLALFWSAVATVTISTASLTFGNQPLGIPSPAQSVTITNTGHTSLDLTVVAVTGTNASDFAETQNCPSIIAPAASCTVSVTFDPTLMGLRTASLTFTDNSIGSPQTVSLSGTGIPVSFSPANLSFVSQAVGIVGSSSLVVTNVGSTSLTITNITITGTNSGDFFQTNNCVGIITTGASCTINITFTPGASGTRGPATLTIFDGAGSQTTTLTGIGSAVLRFVPVAPCRVVDTRNVTGTFGGPFLSGQTSRNFPISSGACGVPSTAAAYSLNVTVVPHGPLSYISVWPTGSLQPLVSTLNSPDGRIKANAAIVPAGTSGSVSVFATNPTDIVLDIDGYFVSASTPTALSFYPLPPCRLVDTRFGLGALAGPSMVAGQVRTFPLLSGSCNIPSMAQAYSLNFTSVPQGFLSYLTVWQAGQTQPLVSTLNAPTGTITANAAIVPAGSTGAISAYATNNSDLVIDVDGYFAPANSGGLSLYTLPPCRVLDTRGTGNGQAFTGTVNVNAPTSACGVPLTAQATAFNMTVVPVGDLNYVTAWPQGTSQPLISTLNATDGAVTSNMAIVPATNGVVSVFATDPTQLIVDISGYFAP